MDVVLLNSGPDENGQITPFRTLGAYKIAHYTRAAGYSCQVIDHLMFMTEQQLRSCVFKFVNDSTAVLAVSTTFLKDSAGVHFPPHLITVLNEVTDRFPNVRLVFGGYGTHLATGRRGPNGFVKNPYAVIQQYGEDIFVDVVNHIKGRGAEPVWTMVQTNGKKLVKQYSTPLAVRFDIEADPFKFVKQDAIMPNESLPIEISRGCIFKCKFCNHLLLGRGKLDYLRSFELVREELISNYELWGTTNYYVICDTFNDTEYKMKEWHRMVTGLPFKIKFTAYLRADLLNRFEDVPYMLAESGLFSCYHGIESFGQQASTTIGKGWSGKSAQEYLPRLYHDIWGKQVFQTLSFIAGLPGDTRESLLDTAHWFNNNDMYNMSWHPLGLSQLQISHSSEFEKNAADYGYSFIDARTWKTDYWDYNQAKDYVKQVLEPTVNPHNARHGSWKILQLLQMGYSKENFLKENKNNWTKDDQDSKGAAFIASYIDRLLAF